MNSYANKKTTLMALAAAMLMVLAAAAVLSVSLRFRVPPGLLVGKMRESFLVAFRTASVDASYGLNRNCCVSSQEPLF